MSPRQRLVSSCLWGSVAILVAACFITAVQAAPPNDPATRLVDDALAREAQGTESGREQLLKAAVAQSPDCAPARWHLGYVKSGNRWVKFDEAAKGANAHARSAYRGIRERYPQTVAAQLELAKWCVQKELLAEARAHFTKVLELEPDHAEARALLGFRRVDGAWLSEPEIAAARQRSERAIAATKEWKPKLEALAKQLASRNAKTREVAAEQVKLIRDPEAIPAMESALSSANEPAAQVAVEALAGMSAYEASLALARHAVFSPWIFVRQEAAMKLKDRSVDHYVPAMLSALYTPIQTRAELYRTPGGRLLYRHTFYREGQEQRDLAIFDTNYERIAAQNGNARDTLNRAVGAATATATAREAAIAQQNATQQELNERVCQVLAYTTGASLPAEADTWWTWWYEYNEVFQTGDKPVREAYLQSEVAVPDTSLVTTGGGGGQRYECLVAGTKVRTLDGPVAIERIQVGDQVLSQNPHTGELAYKPVLRTTIRPAGPLLKLTTARETIRTSGGHPFWVSGRGWVKARDLKAGMALHATNNVHLRSVENAEAERTYNLIVADFHTYFVGDDLILSHDNTVREVTNSVVPGFAGR